MLPKGYLLKLKELPFSSPLTKELIAEIERLQALLDGALKALRFYSDINRYHDEKETEWSIWANTIMTDEGEKARDFLKKVEG